MEEQPCSGTLVVRDDGRLCTYPLDYPPTPIVFENRSWTWHYADNVVTLSRCDVNLARGEELIRKTRTCFVHHLQANVPLLLAKGQVIWLNDSPAFSEPSRAFTSVTEEPEHKVPWNPSSFAVTPSSSSILTGNGRHLFRSADCKTGDVFTHIEVYTSDGSLVKTISHPLIDNIRGLFADSTRLYVSTSKYILMLSAQTGDELGVVTCVTLPSGLYAFAGRLYLGNRHPNSVAVVNLETLAMESRLLPVNHCARGGYHIARSGDLWFFMQDADSRVCVHRYDDWREIRCLSFQGYGCGLTANSRFLFVCRKNDVIFFDLAHEDVATGYKQGTLAVSGNSLWSDENFLFVQNHDTVTVATLPTSHSQSHCE